jgi:Tfp pilus assembly protein PilZ
MDPVSSARTARESLARGLAALQSPGLPPQLMTVADPVAQAMSALHRIEASGGAAAPEAAPAALNFVRQALAQLQAQGIAHPAVDQGMEAIAGSLGIVHQLAQAATQPAAAMQPVSPYAGTMMMDQGQLAPPASAMPATQPSQNLPYQNRPETRPQPQVAYANPPPQAPAPAWQPQAQPQPAPAYAQQPPQQPPYAQQPAYGQQPPQQPAYAAPAAPAPAAYAQPAAVARPGAPAAGGVPRFEAELGAHSPTNFYKGLSGNDVIESGGLFIATYQIPAIGTQIVLHVSLPGGYEFESQAVVRWTREAPNSGVGPQEAPPGFGAQFTQISAEGRQLVYRYVRNREPLFHDDF